MDILPIVLLVLALALFYSLYNNNKLQKLNSTLLSKNTKLKLELSKSLEDSEEIFSIDPGDKARRI